MCTVPFLGSSVPNPLPNLGVLTMGSLSSDSFHLSLPDPQALATRIRAKDDHIALSEHGLHRGVHLIRKMRHFGHQVHFQICHIKVIVT